MGDEEFVEFGGPRWPRWGRVGGLVLVGLAALVLVAVRVWPGQDSTQAVVAPWPSAQGACASVHDLAIVSSTPPKERTGLRVLLGGDRVRTVDFDGGPVATVGALRPGEFGDVLGNGLVVTRTCALGGSRILRLGDGEKLSVLGSLESLLAGPGGVWVVTFPPDTDHGDGFVRPLDSDRWTRLPVGFTPYAVSGDELVGLLDPSQSGPPSRLVIVSATTGRKLADLGQDAQPVATGIGQIVWTTGCDPSGGGPCDLHRRRLRTGSTSTYRVPRPVCCSGVVSPDGKLVAFLLERSTDDPRYAGHPMRPSDIAVLQLDTGRLEIVPGIELPAKSSPGLAFSADGRWLAIALDAGPRIRLLAWRPGLQLPYETGPIPGQVLRNATVAVLAGR
ncbi:hypothetical protein [Kribbella sp. NPDC004536]|uniref:hypothetical protein n=1 Tax=Kribbella sp. NPDC004536 TaxID=3364106 RepID=UPI0036972D06